MNLKKNTELMCQVGEIQEEMRNLVNSGGFQNRNGGHASTVRHKGLPNTLAHSTTPRILDTRPVLGTASPSLMDYSDSMTKNDTK